MLFRSTPYDPGKTSILDSRTAPGEDWSHPLGTDVLGRDVLTRLIYGARTSMTVSLLVQAITVLIGVPIGALSGYLGGKLDFVVTRIIDVMTAFPSLLFAILIISVLEGGLPTIIIALSVTGWIGIARLTRAQFLTLREQEYALAARDRKSTRLNSSHSSVSRMPSSA